VSDPEGTIDVSDQRKRTSQNAPQVQLPGRPVLRLFIGIPLAAATANDLAAAVHRLQSTSRDPAVPDNLRWSAAESWHITLQFLGSTTPQQYECITARLRELDNASVSIELGGIGTFDRAGVLFIDVRISPQLLALQQTVTAATSPCGFLPEDRPYHPHITLARKKGKGGDRQFRNLKLQIKPPPHLSAFHAESFILYESVATPEGSRYEARERYMLRALK
jgi:RNA 2',3'-cyclic 3'-phosphodiesterase